jgi:hypothetical protein
MRIAVLLAICCGLLFEAHVGFPQGLLLVPDANTASVWAFDPYDGSLVSQNLIPSDSRLSSPVCAIDSGHGTILISDQVENAIFEYGYDGTFIRELVDSSQGLQNLRGIAVYHSNLYVTVGDGAFAGTIQRFDLQGSSRTTWAAAGVGDPFDILFRDGDALVSDIAQNKIQRFDLDGNYAGPWTSQNCLLAFPEQIATTQSGGILVAGFSQPNGIYEFDSQGNQIGYYAAGVRVRGVYELGNGNILFTASSKVLAFNRSNGETATIVDSLGSSFRYIEPTQVPEPMVLPLIAAAACYAAALWRSRRRRV